MKFVLLLMACLLASHSVISQELVVDSIINYFDISGNVKYKGESDSHVFLAGYSKSGATYKIHALNKSTKQLEYSVRPAKYALEKHLQIDNNGNLISFERNTKKGTKSIQIAKHSIKEGNLIKDFNVLGTTFQKFYKDKISSSVNRKFYLIVCQGELSADEKTKKNFSEGDLVYVLDEDFSVLFTKIFDIKESNSCMDCITVNNSGDLLISNSNRENASIYLKSKDYRRPLVTLIDDLNHPYWSRRFEFSKYNKPWGDYPFGTALFLSWDGSIIQSNIDFLVDYGTQSNSHRYYSKEVMISEIDKTAPKLSYDQVLLGNYVKYKFLNVIIRKERSLVGLKVGLTNSGKRALHHGMFYSNNKIYIIQNINSSYEYLIKSCAKKSDDYDLKIEFQEDFKTHKKTSSIVHVFDVNSKSYVKSELFLSQDYQAQTDFSPNLKRSHLLNDGETFLIFENAFKDDTKILWGSIK